MVAKGLNMAMRNIWTKTAQYATREVPTATCTDQEPLNFEGNLFLIFYIFLFYMKLLNIL